jgi:hypothetical protein
MVTVKGNNTVEIRNSSGEVLIIGQSGYELAQRLLKIAEETSPHILRAAAQHWENDPEEKKESALLAKFIYMYLESI